MNTYRARGLKVGTLVVAMLAAIGTWELYKGIAKPTARAEAWEAFDHFKCYFLVTNKQDYPAEIQVRLQNQFGNEEATVLTQVFTTLCVPTAKEVVVTNGAQPQPGLLPGLL
jgi:hypothetical protein